MCVLALGGNFLVVLGRLLMKEKNVIHSLYVTNLSFSDFLMGIYLMVIALADINYRGNYIEHRLDWMNNPLCLISGFLNALSSESSVFILSVITWDRLVNITDPFIYRQQNTKKAIYISFCIWIVALIMAIAPTVFQKIYFTTDFYTSNGVCLALFIDYPWAQGWQYSAAMFMFLNGIGLIFIVFAYIKIIRAVQLSTVALRTTQERQDCVVAVRVAVIVGTNCLCWIPVIVIKAMALAEYEISDAFYAWLAVVILPINSALNPLIYTLTTPKFRDQIFRLLRISNWQQSNNFSPDDTELSSNLQGRVFANKSKFFSRRVECNRTGLSEDTSLGANV